MNRLSVCAETFRTILSHIYLSLGKVLSKSEMGHVQPYSAWHGMTHQQYIICISETYLDSSIDENTLKLDGYSLIRADYRGNMKRGGVCLYYKENLLLRHINTEYFPQYLLCTISIQNQTA